MGCVSSTEEEGSAPRVSNEPVSNKIYKKQPPRHLHANDFTALKVLGQGGYGTVYRVQHKQSGKTFALKSIDKRFTLSNEFRLRQTFAERDVMVEVFHPHMVMLYAAFQDEFDLFLLMPEMEGGDLANFLQNVGLMSEGMCQFYAAEMILALEFLHSKNIVFRDLKPSNVLMDRSGHIKLSDYGLAVNVRKGGQVDVAGTTGYMAPEALAQLHPAPSFDVWCFGVTLYKLMTAHRPFKTSESVLNDPLHFNSPHAKSLSATTKDFLTKLLMKKPSDRLGCGPLGWQEVKAHPFFSGVQWSKISGQKPPWMPPQTPPKPFTPAKTSIENNRNYTADKTTEKVFDAWYFRSLLNMESAFIWDPDVPLPDFDHCSAIHTPPARNRSFIQAVAPSAEPRADQNLGLLILDSHMTQEPTVNSTINSVSDLPNCVAAEQVYLDEEAKLDMQQD